MLFEKKNKTEEEQKVPFFKKLKEENQAKKAEKKAFKESWKAMTDEEKKAFKEKEKADKKAASESRHINNKAKTWGLTDGWMECMPIKQGLTRQDKIIIFSGCDKFIDDYLANLRNGEISENPFDETEYLYHFINNFNKSEPATREFEFALLQLKRHFNILCRQVTGKAKGLDEKAGAKAVIESYNTANSIKKHNRNILKEVAWGVTHSLLTGMLLDEKHVFDIIPKGEIALKNMNEWNRYIMLLTDVPEEVKTMFYIDPSGTTLFTRERAAEYAAEIVKEATPTDDIPFDTDKDVEGATIDLDKEFKAAVELDNAKEEIKAAKEEAQDEVVLNVEPAKEEAKTSKEVSFGELKKESSSDAVNPAAIAAQMAAKAGVAIQSSPEIPIVQDTLDEGEFNSSNLYFQAQIAKLDKFTRCANKIGRNVIYYPTDSGLLFAQIVDVKTGQIVNNLLVDPYLIYGDNIRILRVPAEGEDIRKMIFVPISKENLVNKMIRGTFTTADEKEIRKNLPAIMNDFDSKYHLLDRVDFRGLMTEGYGRGIPFKDWKVLVGHLEEIFKDPAVPTARFRFLSLESKDKFTLIADPDVRAAFPTEIYKEPECLAAIANGTRVDYEYQPNKEKCFMINTTSK